jgi:hypothetical protein
METFETLSQSMTQLGEQGYGTHLNAYLPTFVQAQPEGSID